MEPWMDEDGPMDLEDQFDALFDEANSVCQDCNFIGGYHADDCLANGAH